MSRASSLLALTVLFLTPAFPAHAKFNATVTKAPSFDPASVSKVLVVTRQCHEVVDCSEIERQIVGAVVELGSPFGTVPEVAVREHLFAEGVLEYDPEMRQDLAEHFGADAVMELVVPFAERGDGFGGRRRSSVKIEIYLLRPDGAILFHGTGTGRPKNVVSGPERVSGNIVEEILEEVFGLR